MFFHVCSISNSRVQPSRNTNSNSARKCGSKMAYFAARMQQLDCLEGWRACRMKQNAPKYKNTTNTIRESIIISVLFLLTIMLQKKKLQRPSNCLPPFSGLPSASRSTPVLFSAGSLTLKVTGLFKSSSVSLLGNSKVHGCLSRVSWMEFFHGTSNIGLTQPHAFYSFQFKNYLWQLAIFELKDLEKIPL